MQGVPGYVSSTANTYTGVSARGKSGFGSPVLAGKVFDGGASGGPIPVAGGVMCVQSTAALLNQVVTTSATGLQHASFVYIPVTTGSLTGAAAPPYTGVGTPIVWNDDTKAFMVWSSGSVSWMQFVGTTSIGGFTTSV